jgi:hypothetical protein
MTLATTHSAARCSHALLHRKKTTLLLTHLARANFGIVASQRGDGRNLDVNFTSTQIRPNKDQSKNNAHKRFAQPAQSLMSVERYDKAVCAIRGRVLQKRNFVSTPDNGDLVDKISDGLLQGNRFAEILI